MRVSSKVRLAKKESHLKGLCYESVDWSLSSFWFRAAAKLS